MATNPYEVEHGIKPTDTSQRRRRVDMSTFTSHLHSIQPNQPSSTSTSTSSSTTRTHHAGPTPVDMASLFRLVQDQLSTLAADAPTEANRDFLGSLFQSLQEDVDAPPDRLAGVDEAFLADLDRVPKKRLEKQQQYDDTCPICAERFLDDPYPLVVELPCPGRHAYDLECISPWMLTKGTCPSCRHDFR
ncbi:hypothetical protein F5Y17DRAFT_441934, partial [Xylariaceae sp. FL0594]